MPGEDELVERESHLATLASMLDSARCGAGRVALVHGEAGIGKTALVERFLQLHARAGTRRLWGGCDLLSTPLPLAPVLDVARAHGGPLAVRIAQGASRDDVFQAYIAALGAPGATTIAVIEDAHWADEATLDLIRFVGRRIERLGALMVITWRDDERGVDQLLGSAIGELPRGVGQHIALHGLSPAAVEALAARARRPAAGLHAATSGNPFFVIEALDSDGSDVPPTVRDAVLARTARLSREARWLAELVSVSPARLELAVLGAAAGDRLATLDELVGTGTLTLVDDAVAFRHELARRAIEGSLSPLHARELHARLLAALQAPGAPPDRLARLVHHAAGAGDAAALLRLAPLAAQQASRLGAHRDAERHLAAALRHAVELPARGRAELLEAHSVECYLTDQLATAISSRSAACDLWRELGDPMCEGSSLIWLARMLWFDARHREACGASARAIALLAPLPPSPALAMAWSGRATLHTLDGETAQAIALCDEALALARAHSCHDIEAYALDTLGCARVVAGDDRGWQDLEHSVDLALHHDHPDLAARGYCNLALLAVEERRYPDAERWIDQAIAFTADRDLGTRMSCAIALRARLRTEQGRWADAEADASRVLASSASAAVFRVASLTAMGMLRARQGDPTARVFLDDAWRFACQSREPGQLVPVAAARAELAWLAGDLAGTVAAASPALDAIARLRRQSYTADLALWVWRGGGGGPPAADCAPPISLQLQGDRHAAARAWERLGCPYHAALAHHESDDPADLLAALAALDRLGARPAAARIRRRLSSLGVRSVPRGPRAARRAHPFGLTAREQEVLASLALGLSNHEIGARLFVSAKTVDHHISAILAKLGVTSRGAAVARAHQHGLILDQAQSAGR